jgi:hypothetical protein
MSRLSEKDPSQPGGENVADLGEALGRRHQVGMKRVRT